jgi:hypothetical protein
MTASLWASLAALTSFIFLRLLDRSFSRGNAMGGNMRIDFKRILCRADLSPEADEVLRYAIDPALAYEAKLFVRHCVGSSPPADESRVEQIKRLIARG